jgi:two-component system LytT family response regulator
MAIKSMIIDDEINNVENLEIILRTYCHTIAVVATATSGADAMALITLHQPDLLFLDIQMPQLNGFELLKALPDINFEVIFITAYDQYAMQAIKFSALDYLLKPINIEELKLAVKKAEQKIMQKHDNERVKNLLEYLKAEPKTIQKIALPTLEEIVYVRVDEIIRCEASNNYTTFYLQSGEKILVCKTLKEFSDLLKPYGFIRSHQSHLANQSFIKSFLKEDGGVLLMHDKTKLPISRQNREFVKNTLSRYSFNGRF